LFFFVFYIFFYHRSLGPLYLYLYKFEMAFRVDLFVGLRLAVPEKPYPLRLSCGEPSAAPYLEKHPHPHPHPHPQRALARAAFEVFAPAPYLAKHPHWAAAFEVFAHALSLMLRHPLMQTTLIES
jgi:hypothetical protein